MKTLVNASILLTMAVSGSLGTMTQPATVTDGANLLEEVTVTALDVKTLAARSIADITEVAQVIPSVTLKPSRTTNTTLTAFIRNVGQQDPLLARFKQGVALYIDDIYIARPKAALLGIYDVQRNEVLHSPQGTLYDRNAISGAIKYVTHRLSGDPDLRIRGSLGNYSQRDLTVTGALSLGKILMTTARPGRLSGVLFNDIGPAVEPAGLARIKPHVGHMPALATWTEAVKQTHNINQTVFLDYDLATWERMTRRLFVEKEDKPQQLYDPAIAASIAADDTAAVPPDLWPIFDGLKEMPLMVIRGEHSDILSAECTIEMQQRHPDIRLHEIAGEGHAPGLDRPKTI